MNTSALIPMEHSHVNFSIPDTDAALQRYSFGAATGNSRANGNSRITLNNGEIFINGTHAKNTANVTTSGTVVRVELVGIETRDFNLLDVDSIRFLGRKGNDRFINGTPIQSFAFGNEGNDIMSGGSGNDSMWGGMGNDIISGRAGNDLIYGQFGDDSLYGNDGNDTVSGANGHDVVFGNAGNDFVTGDAGNDLVRGGDGADTVHGWTGQDQVYGGSGNDYVLGGDGSDFMSGGGGHDVMYGGRHDDEINGSPGNDTIIGGDGHDILNGEAGNDIITGGNGNDFLNGGAGNDDLKGNAGNDQLLGSTGKDSLRGGAGRDVLLGGNDTAKDLLFGETGQDHILYFAGDNTGGDNQDLKVKFKNKNSQWTDNELLVVNRALNSLHNATGNNRLVRDVVVGHDLTLEKYNSLQGGAAAINYMTVTTTNGVTTYDRVIRFANWNENNELLNQTRRLAFIHEVAHNFDNTFELSATPNVSPGLYANFKSKSGWTQSPQNNNNNYSQSGDGQWWYLNSAQFYRTYSTINPAEDWATTWELYFDTTAEPPSASSNLGQKLAVVTNFINRLK